MFEHNQNTVKLTCASSSAACSEHCFLLFLYSAASQTA